MKNYPLFLFLFLIVFISEAQPTTGKYKEFLTWSENTKLTWKDFKAEPIANYSEIAMTASAMEFSYTTKNAQIDWKVIVKFFPYLSWSKKDTEADYILNHEQFHFNITELYARLLRKQLVENIKSAKDIQKLKAINKTILSEWEEEQNKYDRETNHSINEEKQTEWNTNIQQRLDELKEFASE